MIYAARQQETNGVAESRQRSLQSRSLLLLLLLLLLVPSASTEGPELLLPPWDLICESSSCGLENEARLKYVGNGNTESASGLTSTVRVKELLVHVTGVILEAAGGK